MCYSIIKTILKGESLLELASLINDPSLRELLSETTIEQVVYLSRKRAAFAV